MVAPHARVHKEKHVARQHGYFIYLHIVHQQDLFKQVIPSTAHRVQVVQHCVAFTASFGLYVVADTGVHGIIRAVLIYVPDDLKRAYIDIFETITRDHLQ